MYLVPKWLKMRNSHAQTQNLTEGASGQVEGGHGRTEDGFTREEENFWLNTD